MDIFRFSSSDRRKSLAKDNSIALSTFSSRDIIFVDRHTVLMMCCVPCAVCSVHAMLLNYQYNEKIPNFFGAHGRRRAGEPLKRQGENERCIILEPRRCVMVLSKSEIERNVPVKKQKTRSTENYSESFLRSLARLVVALVAFICRWQRISLNKNSTSLIFGQMVSPILLRCTVCCYCTAATRGDGQQVFSIIAAVDVVLAVTDARVEHRRIQHISFKLLITIRHIDRATRIAKSTFAKNGMEE